MKSSGAEVPPAFVTVTAMVPSTCAGVVNVSDVPSAASASGVIGAEPSTETVEPAVKPVPVMVTAVPPPTGPSSGVIVARTGAASGGARYVNVWGAEVPVPFVTVTGTGPAAWAGVVNVSDVPSGAIVSGTIGSDPSTETVEPAEKPVPVTVTGVPPPAGPWAGVMPARTGAPTGAGW